MAQSRERTRGNAQAQLSKLRENIKSVNPMAAATLKNATPRDGRTAQSNEITAGDERGLIQPHKLEKISDIIANNVTASNDLRAITPYIDRAELIWSSLLFYPNGKQKTILDYTTRPSRFKNSVLHTALLKVWKDHFTNDYKIEDDLQEMANDMLWNSGSYATLTMSRISLDYLINGMEVVERAGKEGFNPTAVYQQTEGNFTSDKDGSLKVMNLGNYVRPPEDVRKDVFSVNGLEGLIQNPTTTNQTEFDILSGSQLDGNKGFFISLTDNPAILSEKLLLEKRQAFNSKNYSGSEDFSSIIAKSIAQQPSPEKPLNTGTESKGKKPDEPKAITTNLKMSDLNNLQNQIFPHRRVPYQFMQFVKQDTDFGIENYGTPIDWHIPSAAIIPIHINGNVKKKKDYIILIDPYTGDWLNPNADYQYYKAASKPGGGLTNKNSQGSTNGLIDNLKMIQQGKDCDFDMSEFAELSKAVIIEQFMKSIISARGGSISLELDEETNKIFLARMLRGQGVRALYVPGENVTYAAFKYSNLGVGQSLTQQAKMHIARLAALDLADAMANMEAAQSTNQMRITLNKDDPTPERTIAMAREVFFRANPRFYNVLASSQMSIPVLVDAFRELSLTLQVDSNENPHMPVPQIEVTPQDRQNFRKVDPDSRNEVLNKIANYFMLPRGWLDVADDQNNFQIEALNEHRLVYNQVINWQESLAGFIIERELKYTRVNQPLLITLIQVINEHKKLWKSDNGEEVTGSTDPKKIELILEDFLNSLECTLPIPAAMEGANKIKEGLATANELVTQWIETSAKGPMLEKAINALNLSGEYTKDDIEGMIKAYLFTKAHKLLNVPSPFDEAVDDPSGGGISSVVENVVLQNKSTYNFLFGLAERDLKERGDFLKKHMTKLEKALADYQTKSGAEEETPEPTGDGSVVDPNAVPVEPGSEEIPPEGGDDTDIPPEGDQGDGATTDDDNKPTDGDATKPEDASTNDASSTDLAPDNGGKENPFA